MAEQTLTVIDTNHGNVAGIPVLNFGAWLGILSAIHKQPGVVLELTTGPIGEPGGWHNNTAHIDYGGINYLRCKHQHGNLQGVYKSPIFDAGGSDRYLVYIVGQDTDEFDIVVVGTGSTWASQVPIVTTGANLMTDGAFDNWTTDDLDDWTESDSDASEDLGGQAGSCAEITASANYGHIYEPIGVTAEKWYILSGYYKNTAGDTAVFGVYDFWNSNFLTAPDYHELDDATAAWTEFTYLFYTPPGCTNVWMEFGGKTSGDIVFFDTISLLQIDEAKSTTWESIGVATNTWTNIFELDQGPSVTMRLYYGETSPPTSHVDKMEILSAIVTARYFQVQININDPVGEVYAYVEEFSLRFCQ